MSSGKLPEDVPAGTRMDEDVPAGTRMDEDLPERARGRRARKRAYQAAYWRQHRVLLSAQRQRQRRERNAGVRPGGGCVKCGLWLGCGGLFCDQEARA